MLQKRLLVKFLDIYDTHGNGVLRADFYEWLLQQKDWADQDFGEICKCLEDCIDDNWIGKKFKKEIDYRKLPSFGSGSMEFEFPTKEVEYIFVRSRGREITKWKYFIPAVLEKMSLVQLTYFAITTAIICVLAYFGVRGV